MQYHPAPDPGGLSGSWLRNHWWYQAIATSNRQLSNGLCEDADFSHSRGSGRGQLLISFCNTTSLYPTQMKQPVNASTTVIRTASKIRKSGANGCRSHEAQAHIREYLHTKAMRIAVAEYIKALSHSAVIKGFDL